MTFWDECLLRHYKDTPASVSVISGKWKTGKTDFALFLAVDELRDRLGAVESVGTNIKTYDPSITYINNFVDLETWLFKDRKRKVFIFDEALKAAPSRSAMSKQNVKWMQYVPELSKARCHLFVITQEEDYTEKLFIHPTFIRARWIKKSLKTVDLISQLYPGDVYRFNDIPKSKVSFDPYHIATWQMVPDGEATVVDDDIRIALEYANGGKTHEIMEKYGLKYRCELTALVKRALK
ncbi:MAG: hypothetical protein ACP5KV_07290, partial [Candidatus Methanomethylicaceae archaeon]